MEALATVGHEGKRITELGDYRILSELEHEYCVGFKVVQVVSRDMDGMCDYPLTDDGDCFNTTTNVNEAFAFLTAFCKGDGCFQLYFKDEPALHFDDKFDIENFGKVIPRMYEIAREMMGDKWYADR